MRGFLNMPQSLNCKVCKHCGAAPIIFLTDQALYVVKCPNDDGHYQTAPGVIDVEDWNFHNTDVMETGRI
ncbi:hypothetical protein DYU05_16305 [Mucilaginibacter terrenus]|uniref:Uncharacterized protein n=1 Tax=Mucilaginibacter terrenus TaxID=2482727 RepID=A0A3E2NMI8_9SPHI|nr:hypothetical protein [Mucilaginibacter terrenus]RFZ82181.1 hypothetical protein DYU05_16305 [Mucilaginibacter terrenus]